MVPKFLTFTSGLLGLAVFAFLGMLLLPGCTFNSEEELYGNVCDTTNISFNRVEPIFQANCVVCHNASYNNGDIVLDSFARAVEAAQTGKQRNAINHLPGATPMPYQGNKLPECPVLQVTT